MINLWLDVDQNLHDDIVEFANWDEETQGVYPGPLNATDEAIFSTFADAEVVQNMFRKDRAQGRDWLIYSLYVVDAEIDDVVDFMEAQHGNQYRIMGAWHYDDGRQYGTEWDEDVLTGTPTYPISSRLLNHMPTIKTYDENGDLISEDDPTVNTDVNVLQGQALRTFT